MPDYRRDSGVTPDQDSVSGGGICEGDACQMVALDWDERRGVYVVTSRADREVRLQLRGRFFTIELLVPPHGEAVLETDSVEHPFRATYDRDARITPGD